MIRLTLRSLAAFYRPCQFKYKFFRAVKQVTGRSMKSRVKDLGRIIGSNKREEGYDSRLQVLGLQLSGTLTRR